MITTIKFGLTFIIFIIGSILCHEELPKSKINNLNVPLHHFMSESEKLILFGHESNVPLYEVVEPNGLYKFSHSNKKQRRIRSIVQNSTNQHINSYTNTNQIDRKRFPHELFVNFQAFGERFVLKLKRNSRLLSPSFTVHEEIFQKDITDDTISASSNCFYHGYCISHQNSSAAISMCDGMRGIIETQNAIYVINPLPKRVVKHSNRIANQSHVHPHIILKKETLDGYHCPHRKKSLFLQEFLNVNESLLFEPSKIRNKRSIESTTTTTTNTTTTTTSTFVNTTLTTSKSLSDVSINKDLNLVVETAVFIDETLYSLMKKTFPSDTEQQIVTYVLTIMNAVQLLFKQPSLGRNIEISVVLMDILKQQPMDLASSDNIDTYLTNFCVWQHNKRLHTRGLTPRWDHALLLSGINMYVVDGHGRKKRHVVGLAPVSGMCNSLNSCTISEGTSFQTVLVAGHEMGHSLGMEHDGSQDGNNCDHDNFIMSSTLGAGKTSWSKCSRDYLEKFIHTPQASCILSHNNNVNIINQFISPDKLPGQLYTADQQCSLRFGSDARRSSVQQLEDVCRLLRCDTGSDRNIVSYHAHPALEGTTCGIKKWCREGKCIAQDITEQSSTQQAVAITSPQDTTIKPIDGNWGEWTSFGVCMSECVTKSNLLPMGVMISTRKCDNPSPKNNGKSCDGPDKRIKLCDSSHICSIKSTTTVKDYISDICKTASRRNNNLEPIGTQYPSYDSSHSCFVWCQKRGGGYMTQGWKLPDGTPCGKEKVNFNNRFCYNGECKLFDCDGLNTDGNNDEICSSSSILSLTTIDQSWSSWQASTKCRYSCITNSKGYRLVTRECNSVNNCAGRRDSFQLCSEVNEHCDSNSMKTAQEYANEVCQKYRNKYPSLLSGRGRQLSTKTTNIHSSCIVACQDRIWREVHYQMDTFEDGKFPFGTDCSMGSEEKAHCLDGKCIKFDENDLPIQNDLQDYLNVRQLFGREYRFHNRHKRSGYNYHVSGIQTNEDISSEIASWERLNRLKPARWRSPTPLRPVYLSSSDGKNGTLHVEPYVWGMTLSECTKPCGGGTQVINVFCHAGKNIVDNSYCNQMSKPGDNRIERCNTHQCVERWRYG